MGRYRHVTGEGPWFLRLVDGKPDMVVQLDGSYSQRRASVAVNDGAWHHVAAVWDPGVRLDVYVDGVRSNGPLQSSGTLLARINAAADVPVRIGTIELPVGSFYGDFPGALDDVRYSSGARYDADFVPAEGAPADAATIGLWRFEEGSGSVTAGEGRMAGPATLVNDPAWLSLAQPATVPTAPSPPPTPTTTTTVPAETTPTTTIPVETAPTETAPVETTPTTPTASSSPLPDAGPRPRSATSGGAGAQAPRRASTFFAFAPSRVNIT